MKFGKKWVVCLAMMLGAATAAVATNYSLWINGIGNDGARVGKYDDFGYWGSSSVDAGVNKVAVNWDGYNRISDQNAHIRDALDCFCTGQNWCYIAAHSAGNLQIGYALSLYGGTARTKKTGVVSGGSCAAADGSTQTGWNIKWVDIAAGAAGGSELADTGSWLVSDAVVSLAYPMISDLKTTTSRAMYDHNQTRAKWFYMYAGAKGSLDSFLLPGQDDLAVAYHSAGGTAGSGGRKLCNPSDWFCNDLTLGTAANEGGSVKWSYHSVAFRDDKEAYSHLQNGKWAGVVSLVRADMAANAK